ncbi:MAG: hypothetical protein KAR38_03860 [Calditrichia bacterium]|nr:hypothetical protein [Calditrichia bacterium]
MKRRDFLKFSLIATINFNQYGLEAAVNNIMPQKNNNFPLLEVEGDYKTIGYKMGKHFKNNYHLVIKGRNEWYQKLLKNINTKNGKNISNELLRITKKYFPQYLEELKGVSEGTGIDFNHIWAMSIKSELLALEEESPGCSTISYKNKNNLWLFHNEDGHEAYYNQMFLVKVKPPSGVSFLSLVYPGTLTGNGPSLNSNGIIQTTNYISSTKSQLGIPRYIIGRAILEVKTLKEAVEIATINPRTYPYHHNLAGFAEKKYFSVETIPGRKIIIETSGLYFHTNHLVSDLNNKFTYQDKKYVNSSSESRYKVIQEAIQKLKDTPVTAKTLLNILSSHKNAPYSPCRHPREQVKGQTLGTAFIDINKGIFKLYRGNPCKAVKNNNYKVLTC